MGAEANVVHGMIRARGSKGTKFNERETQRL